MDTPELTVDAAGSTLMADGHPYPLIIDTVWSAFADPSIEEWRLYLELRRQQGFTAALVSILPILHDRETRPTAREPFALDDAGAHRFDTFDESFWATAREFTRIAHQEYGIRLMLTVIWNNYLAGTWGARRTPQAVMPNGARRAYIEKVTTTFGDLDPIFVIGGDDYYSDSDPLAAYVEAMRHIRASVPRSMLTTHTAPGAILPDALASGLDFYLHQSGHDVRNQALIWEQSERLARVRPKRPVVNSEPPYEQHGRVGGEGRWSRDEVRRASWQTLLAGASAGIGYGAHGVWMWHSPDGRFEALSSLREPLPWPVALALPGASDISLLAALHRSHGLHRLSSAQHLGVAPPDGVRIGASPDEDLIVVYLPFAIDVVIERDLAGYSATGWDLGDRVPVVPRIAQVAQSAHVETLATASDQLIILERRPSVRG